LRHPELAQIKEGIFLSTKKQFIIRSTFLSSRTNTQKYICSSVPEKHEEESCHWLAAVKTELKTKTKNFVHGTL
jgi:hypothetical protein